MDEDWGGDIGSALDAPTRGASHVVASAKRAPSPEPASSDEGDLTAELSDDAPSRSAADASDATDWPAEPDAVPEPTPRALTHSSTECPDLNGSPNELPTPFEFPSNGVHLAFAPDPTDAVPDAEVVVAEPATPDPEDSAVGAFTSISLSPEHPQVKLQRERLGKTTLDGFGHRAESPPRASTSSHKRTSSIKSIGSRPSSRLDTAPHANGAAARSASSVASSAAAEPEVATPTQDAVSTAPAPPIAGPSKPRAKLNKPSALEKHLSKTRQRDLPPKEPREDKKHLKEFNHMLITSKKGEKQKAAKQASERLARELNMASDLPAWEKEILPNWRAVLDDERLRRIWWSGTMPARYRANLWASCIGNGLAIGKASYARLLSRATSIVSAGKMPAHVLEAIDADIARVLPSVKLFQPGGPMAPELRNVLLAYSIFWSVDRPSYPPGVAWPAALLLISMPVQDSFVSLVNLVSKSFLKSFYADKREEIDAYYRIFSTMLADAQPSVYRNFLEHDVRPALYLRPWLVTLFAQHLPLDCATRLFDIFVLEGDSSAFRIALALLRALEARLFNPDRAELEAMFRGEDRGARAIAARERNVPESEVGIDDVYVRLTGGGEDALFEALAAQEWREKTWARLVERELPE